ncbi:ABC transporter substrate-binding protein [Pseudonocardia kunmingensis]|uniref:ABC transporter substrate-binding protein n=1 Tax=Pseudonocardia kunmingensis TaxID=630975 RepID=UPI00114FB5BB|nr:ABC transporter substrate-binding protein [Pseudonocardia kunmingensis]
MRARRVVAALAGLLALLLAGCAPIPQSADSAAAAGEPGTFRYAYELSPSRLDPHRASISQDGVTLFPAYDRLVHLSPEGEPVPGLAAAWEWEDALTLRLELREGVTFHDGTPFDAAAVRTNIERARTVEGSAVRTELDPVQSVEVRDPRTVALHLSYPATSLPAALSDRAGAMISPAALADPAVDLDQVAVGAGPYRMVEHRRDELTRFERFPQYWDPPAAAAQRLEIHHIAESTTRLNAVRTGVVDATRVPPAMLAQAEATGLRTEVAGSLNFSYFVLNRSRPIFADVRVRRAINHALDREAIRQGVYLGHATIEAQPFVEGYWAHHPGLGDEAIRHDPQLARQLLAEAGHPGGLAFRAVIPTGPDFLPLAEAMQNQLAAVGIDMEIVPAEPDTMGDLMFVQERYDAMIASWGPRADPSMTVATRYTADGFGNPGGHSTPRLEELHRQALRTLDQQQRAVVLHELVAEVVDQVLEIPVIFPHDVYVTSPRVQGLEPRLMHRPEFRGVAVS